MMRDSDEETPAMRKRPQKLSRPRLSESEMVGFVSEHVASPANHLFSISFMASPSVKFRIALETSGTRGEPLGKTWYICTKEETLTDATYACDTNSVIHVLVMWCAMCYKNVLMERYL